MDFLTKRASLLITYTSQVSIFHGLIMWQLHFLPIGMATATEWCKEIELRCPLPHAPSKNRGPGSVLAHFDVYNEMPWIKSSVSQHVLLMVIEARKFKAIVVSRCFPDGTFLLHPHMAAGQLNSPGH